MKIQIEYGEDVIVGVIYRRSFFWYVTEKEVWFLDQNKWGEAFSQAGYEVPEGTDRFGIDVVDETTADRFLSEIESFRVLAGDLRAAFAERLREAPEEARDEFAPALLVDFDARRLASMFPEPSSFEDFVPSGWTGQYCDFLEEVPRDERYWIHGKSNMLHAPLES